MWGSTTLLCFGFELDIRYYPLMPHLSVLERMGNIPSCFFYDTCKFIDSAVVWVSWGVFLSDWRVLVILVIPHLKVAPCLTVLLRNLPIFPWPSLRWEDTTALWVTMKHPPVSHCGWDCVLVMDRTANPQCHHLGETCPHKSTCNLQQTGNHLPTQEKQLILILKRSPWNQAYNIACQKRLGWAGV